MILLIPPSTFMKNSYDGQYWWVKTNYPGTAAQSAGMPPWPDALILSFFSLSLLLSLGTLETPSNSVKWRGPRTLGSTLR